MVAISMARMIHNQESFCPGSVVASRIRWKPRQISRPAGATRGRSRASRQGAAAESQGQQNTPKIPSMTRLSSRGVWFTARSPRFRQPAP